MSDAQEAGRPGKEGLESSAARGAAVGEGRRKASARAVVQEDRVEEARVREKVARKAAASLRANKHAHGRVVLVAEEGAGCRDWRKCRKERER